VAQKKKRLFDLSLSGQVSLDLANTVDWRTSEQRKELLNSFADLVRWGRHVGIVTDIEARRLTRAAGAHAAEANRVLMRTLDLRETLFRIYSAITRGRRPNSSDLEILNRELADAFSHLRIGPSQEGYRWEWVGTEINLSRILWSVARAAGDFLTSNDLKMLRECPGEGCAWLFVDTSRNRTRRWCSMEVCGNRAKARRHYRLANN